MSDKKNLMTRLPTRKKRAESPESKKRCMKQKKLFTELKTVVTFAYDHTTFKTVATRIECG